MTDEDQKVVALIKHGGGIVGGAAGGLIGFLAGGPIGAVFGGALGAALQSGASDVADRVLSHREQMRVGATMWYALEFIRERLERGDRPREDGFLRQDETGRYPAEEIFEGALLKMKNEHEERKAPFYARLVTNVSFESDCSPAEANYLLHVMDSLTFMQLSLISLFRNAEQFAELPTSGYAEKQITGELSNVLAATFELCQNGLVSLREAGAENGTVVLDPTEIEPAHMSLRPVGQRLYDLAGLEVIGESDELVKLAKLMKADTHEASNVAVKASYLRNR